MQPSFPASQGAIEGPYGAESQRWTASCPGCRSEYSPIEARIVAEKEGGYFLFHECNGCRSSIVSTLVEENGGISSLGLVTDLTYYDAARFRSGTAITADHILDVYVSLKDLVRPKMHVSQD
ncbi:MAG: hypothetical protein KC925_01600 [Candidatus Doudnabacteria bacterium]|nr:hypothetical protein [Candidatus Doudnabacteria bacterium]